MEKDKLEVFISYASYDNRSDDPEKRWLDRLVQCLQPLDLEGHIAVWEDTKLQLGSNWTQQIHDAIEHAKVAILLVSPAFLASEFIRSQELPKLLKKADMDSIPDVGNDGDVEELESLVIIPIVVRPCLIEHTKFSYMEGKSEMIETSLSQFQFLPKEKAMNGLSQYEQDEQFKQVALRVKEALEESQSDIGIDLADSFSNRDNEDLRKLLIKFLTKYKKYWFNVIRIKKWGPSQPGFQLLDNFDVHDIRVHLQRLIEMKLVDVKDGKRSKVYKIKRTKTESK